MNSSSRRRLVCGMAALTLVGAVLPASQVYAVEPLRVSAIPDEAPTELQRKFAPLGKYLEKSIGRPVQFVPVTDYASVVEALAAKKLDMAWLGGFTYVQAKLRSNGAVVPLVQRAEDAKFTSRFITADPTIKTLADIKGKSFAFGSASSTSGHLMPRYFMLQAGINPEKDLKTVAFSGAHDATVAFVAAGKVAAGVLNASVWDKLVETKKVDTSRVRVFSTTPPYYDYNWTVRGDLPADLQQKIRDAFLRLDPNKPEDKEILDLQRASKFVPTQPENYAGIEEAGRSAGLIK